MLTDSTFCSTVSNLKNSALATLFSQRLVSKFTTATVVFPPVELAILSLVVINPNILLTTIFVLACEPSSTSSPIADIIPFALDVSTEITSPTEKNWCAFAPSVRWTLLTDCAELSTFCTSKFWSFTSVKVTFASVENPKPPFANSKSTKPVASAIAVTLAVASFPDSATTSNVSPILLSLPPKVILIPDSEPVTTGMPSVRPSELLATISPLKKLPLKLDKDITCVFMLFITLVAILSTNAFAPLVPPTISKPSKDIRLSMFSAYTSMYLGNLNSELDGFKTSSLG